MKTLSFAVTDRVCEECSLAFACFMDGIEGVESVHVDGRYIAIVFDQEKTTGECVSTAARDSLEKLGHILVA